MVGSETRPHRNPLFANETNMLANAGSGVIVESDFTGRGFGSVRPIGWHCGRFGRYRVCIVVVRLEEPGC